MLVLDKPQDLKDYVGKELGVSDWLAIDQDRINQFADATGDHQWIHVDVERAQRELPIGNTIAHGFLTLSLIPMLVAEIFTITSKTRGINYGLNRVRFTGMVPAGSRVRRPARRRASPGFEAPWSPCRRPTAPRGKRVQTPSVASGVRPPPSRRSDLRESSSRAQTASSLP